LPVNALALLLTLASYLPGAEAKYPQPSCQRVEVMLALDRPQILAGQFRTTEGVCIVWLNIAQHWWPSRVCNSTYHEARHLHGDRHPIPREKSCRP
jgi:hypothetical protein